MLRTLKFILLNFRPKIIGDIDSKNLALKKKLETFEFLQKTFNEADVTITALYIIKETNDPLLVNEAIVVLINLLQFGNIQVQNKIFDVLKSSHFTKDIFEYISIRFKKTIRYIFSY